MTRELSQGRKQSSSWTDHGKNIVGAGTPGYMSFEQSHEDHIANPSDDVHALGIIWCELLLGELDLFHGRPPSFNRFFEWQRFRKELLDRGLTEDQVSLVQSCVERHEHRPKDAVALIAEMKEHFPSLRDKVQADADEIERLRTCGGYWVGKLREMGDRQSLWNAALENDISAGYWLNGLNWENAIRCDGNLDTAFHLIRSAATLGYSSAQYDLALYIKNGVARQEKVSADEWLQKAADQGHVGACYELGKSRAGQFDDSPETTEWQDLEQAVKWLQMAADEGVPTLNISWACSY